MRRREMAERIAELEESRDHWRSTAGERLDSITSLTHKGEAMRIEFHARIAKRDDEIKLLDRLVADLKRNAEVRLGQVKTANDEADEARTEARHYEESYARVCLEKVQLQAEIKAARKANEELAAQLAKTPQRGVDGRYKKKEKAA